MEHQLWQEIVAVLCRVDKGRCRPGELFSDMDVAKVWFWAVLHDRPVSWACQHRNWPLHERKHKRPSNSTMSRRLRTAQVQGLLTKVERETLTPGGDKPLRWMMDGKPLTIGGCSKDRQAGYGRAAGGKAKGYKLHAIVGADSSIPAWRVAPMNTDERVMARRLLREVELQGYVLADANYDSNELHEVCVARGNIQLVTPRRYGAGRGLGHRRQSTGRLRSIELLENPQMKRLRWYATSSASGYDPSNCSRIRRANSAGSCWNGASRWNATSVG